MSLDLPIRVVVEHYGGTIGHRGRLSCIAPDHEDLHPSAKITETKYKCFSCDLRGDALDIIQWMGDASDYASAVREYTKISGRSVEPLRGLGRRSATVSREARFDNRNGRRLPSGSRF